MGSAAALALRSILGAPKRRKRPKRWPRPKSWVPLADAYARALRQLLEPYRQAVEREILGPLEEWTEQAAAELGLRTNDASTFLGPSLDLVQETLDTSFGRGNIVVAEVERTVRQGAAAIDAHSRDDFRRGFKRAIGLDLIGEAPHGEALVRGHIQDNVRLIKTVPKRNLAKVESIVRLGWRDGKRWESIAAELRDALKIADSDAIRIAHDQVGKLNGELARDRQVAVGVEEGYWRNSKDGRVRKRHKAGPGGVADKKIDLEKGHPTEGFPGQRIRCRCYLEPIIPDELLEVE